MVLLDEHAYFGPKQWNIIYASMYLINSFGHIRIADLVHELVHVLQYKRYGLAYISRCWYDQLNSNTYDFGGTEGALKIGNGDVSIKDLPFESQAAVIEMAFIWVHSPTFDLNEKQNGKRILKRIEEI